MIILPSKASTLSQALITLKKKLTNLASLLSWQPKLEVQTLYMKPTYGGLIVNLDKDGITDLLQTYSEKYKENIVNLSLANNKIGGELIENNYYSSFIEGWEKEKIQAFFEGLKNINNVAHLDLSGCSLGHLASHQIGTSGKELVTSRFNAWSKGIRGSTIKSLNLTKNNLHLWHTNDFKVFFKAILENKNIKKLNLSGNDLKHHANKNSFFDLYNLFDSKTELIELNLSDTNFNQLDRDAVGDFFKALDKTKVNTLSLSKNDIVHNQAKSSIHTILKSLGTKVINLDLSSNNLVEAELETFLTSLKKTHIKKLELSKNRLAGYYFYKVPLDKLLGKNPSWKAGWDIKKLLIGLKETKIRHLNLSENNFDENEIEGFSQGLKDTQITTLNLSGNWFTGKKTESKDLEKEILDFFLLLAKTNIQTLNFSNHKIDSKVIARLKEKTKALNINIMFH